MKSRKSKVQVPEGQKMKADKNDLVRIMGEKKHRAAAWMMTKSCFLWLPLLLLLIASGPYRWFGTLAVAAVATDDDEPTPKPWPPQFHSILMVNFSGNLSQIDLWYDWPNGRNFNIIQDQLAGERLYDLEWNNGTSFFYKLESDYCRSVQLEIRILRPNWLDGANYLGQRHVDGFLCNVWEKVDFIWYYEDVVTNKPVQWRFYTGRSIHVMTFEVGAVLEDEKWQAPSYCFREKNETLVARSLAI